MALSLSDLRRAFWGEPADEIETLEGWVGQELTANDISFGEGGGGEGTDDQTAAEVDYDNTTSGLTATQVQAAVDEIVGLVEAKADPSDITTAINNLVDSAPGALDTLNELAEALGDDPDFATTVTNALAGKSDTTHDHDAEYAGVAHSHSLDTKIGYIIAELSEGVWSGDAPARTEGDNVILFVGLSASSDPADPTNGIDTPANINNSDIVVRPSA